MAFQTELIGKLSLTSLMERYDMSAREVVEHAGGLSAYMAQTTGNHEELRAVFGCATLQDLLTLERRDAHRARLAPLKRLFPDFELSLTDRGTLTVEDTGEPRSPFLREIVDRRAMVKAMCAAGIQAEMRQQSIKLV